MRSLVRLLLGDNATHLLKIKDSRIDLTVTSPPYDDLRNYKGFSWNYKIVIHQLYRITKNGGVVVWIVNDATLNGSETGSSFRQALYFMKHGFNLHDTMIYEKAQACFGSNKCYLQSFEYMFVFSKGKPKTINFIRDRENVRGGNVEQIATHGFTKDGKCEKRTIKEYDKFGKRKNIWKYGVGGSKIDHPAIFPYKLAEDHILSWSNTSDVVLDPFMGSGTTGLAALANNRHFVGIELAEQYYTLSKNRINNMPRKIL